MENARASVIRFYKKLALFQKDSLVDEEMAQPPPSPPTPLQTPPPPPPPQTPPPPSPPQSHLLLDYWGKKLTVLCSAAAIEMAMLSAQIHSKQLPPIFSFLGLTIILCFTFFFVGKCIHSNFEQAALVLERIGIFFGVTAIFTAMSIPFQLWFKYVCGFIYALTWFTILVCNYFHAYLLHLLPNKNIPKQNLLPITN